MGAVFANRNDYKPTSIRWGWLGAQKYAKKIHLLLLLNLNLKLLFAIVNAFFGYLCFAQSSY